MKKYKLIKKYPGSPEIGTIIEKKGDGNFYPINQPGGWFNEARHLNPFPEFWEEVVGKEYEILSFKQNSGINDLWINFYGNGWCRNSNGKPATLPYSYDEIINNSLYCIHSVKRLSDGEIFTVGDKIKSSVHLTIRDFSIVNNVLLIHPFQVIGTIYLSKIQKEKQPLFTTEDGVEVYDGYKYTTVEKQSFIINNIDTKALEKFRNIYRHDLFLFFSTREKAEEYILMNKPCLSINEVLNNYASTLYNTHRLEELVKQKCK